LVGSFLAARDPGIVAEPRPRGAAEDSTSRDFLIGAAPAACSSSRSPVAVDRSRAMSAELTDLRTRYGLRPG